MSNPFYTPEEVDDDEFLSHPRAGSSGYILPNHQASNYGGGGGFRPGASPSAPMNRPQDRLQQIQEQKRQIERRTLDSTNNSLGLLLESEKVGLATAEELNRQKEQLLATESRLDDINSTLNNSERHLTGIKSVFGGIRNYIFAKKNGIQTTPGPAQITTSVQASQKEASSSASTSRSPATYGGQSNIDNYHPGLRTRGLIEEDEGASVDDILDRNLDQMSQGLSRLKVLATGLNNELDEHDEILNRLDHKVDKTNWRVTAQNKDMAKLLK